MFLGIFSHCLCGCWLKWAWTVDSVPVLARDALNSAVDGFVFEDSAVSSISDRGKPEENGPRGIQEVYMSVLPYSYQSRTKPE